MQPFSDLLDPTGVDGLRNLKRFNYTWLRYCSSFAQTGSLMTQTSASLQYVVWKQEHRSKLFLSSETYNRDFLPVVKWLTGGNDPQIRHKTLQHQALEDPLGFSLLGYPIGTAIYTGTDVAWEYAWPLWTHIIRHVNGCKGIAGEKVREPVDGLENGYVVYVGWQTMKHHDDYHHTDHFQKHWAALQTGVQGWVEYGYIIFVEIREGIG